MQSNGLGMGNNSGVDLARFMSLKKVNNQACPFLILSNPTNSQVRSWEHVLSAIHPIVRPAQ